jgi:hypothetical protein
MTGVPHAARRRARTITIRRRQAARPSATGIARPPISPARGAPAPRAAVVARLPSSARPAHPGCARRAPSPGRAPRTQVRSADDETAARLIMARWPGRLRGDGWRVRAHSPGRLGRSRNRAWSRLALGPAKARADRSRVDTPSARLA